MADRDNIQNIDGSRYNGKGRNRQARFSWVTPARLGAAIFILVFAYLILNLYILSRKEQVAIYEVQNRELSYDTAYKGICLREESVEFALHSGYVNYYIQNGRKVAKSSIVYSVDNGSKMHTQLSENYEDIQFSTEEIREIKYLISSELSGFDGSDMSKVSSMENRLTDTIYNFVNDNLLEGMRAYTEADTTGSAVFVSRTNRSGVVSYKSDKYVGLTIDDVTSDMFEDKDYSLDNLRVKGLVSTGDPVYRLCTGESWSVVTKVSEDFYLNNLETKTIRIYLNDSHVSVNAELHLFIRNKDYYAEAVINDYMTEYIDDRFVSIRFEQDEENGLKIPLSAVTKKGYYLVPESMFCKDSEFNGLVLKRERYSAESGETQYDSIYYSKYFTDGFYAYIDMSLLNEGDYLCNTDTGERIKVATVNYLEGVYCVNKGYYVFTRIDRIKSNEEYTIIRNNTEGGIKLYDHIALNASDAVEGNIIY